MPSLCIDSICSHDKCVLFPTEPLITAQFIFIPFSRQIEGLDFIPLLEERYDLVVRKAFLETETAEKLLEILHAVPFKKENRSLSGNDYRDMGRIISEV